MRAAQAPSLVLVVMADQLGRSVGDMYKGAWGPSILQILIFAVYTFVLGVIIIAVIYFVPQGLLREAIKSWALLRSRWFGKAKTA